MSCVFCQIVAGDAEAFVVGTSDGAVAFLDIRPLTRGHTLVVPIHHVESIFDGGADVLQVVAPLVEEVSRLLVARLGAEGVTLFQSNGEAAGQEVPHLHVHVLPRWRGDGVLRPLVGEQSTGEDLDALHTMLSG